MRWWPPLLHLSLIAVLLPLVWLRLGSAVDDTPAAQAASVQPRSDAAAVADYPAAEERPVDLEMLIARPLFGPDRRPVTLVSKSAPPSAEGVRDRAADLRMVGYLSDGQKPRAILLFESSGAQATVREGDVFEGFDVRSIRSGSVVVAEQGKESTIRMFDQ
jgi:type II secretory pathway component PulC